MRYLVTGGIGFIGSRVAELLLDGGAEVCGADNLNPAYDVRLKEWRLARLQARPGFSFQRLDVRDAGAVNGLLERGFDAVINLAAMAGVRQSVAEPRAYIDANIVGVLNLLQGCRDYGIPKLVQASSSSVYGGGGSVYGARGGPPFREDALTDRPLSPYAATKKASELLCHAYHYLNGTDVTVFRFFTVYGPAGRPDMMLFRVVQWIAEGQPVIVYGDGQQERNFTYVDDVALGVVAGLQPVGFEVINLGSRQAVKLMDAIALAERLLGKKARVEHRPSSPADAAFNPADIAKAREVLGWEPQVGLEEGLSRTVAWYLENREWARDLVTL